jgi:hypothetical protein
MVSDGTADPLPMSFEPLPTTLHFFHKRQSISRDSEVVNPLPNQQV